MVTRLDYSSLCATYLSEKIRQYQEGPNGTTSEVTWVTRCYYLEPGWSLQLIRWDFVSSWDSTKQLIPALSSFPGFFDWKTPCQDLAKAEGRDFKSEAFVKSAMSDGHVAHAASAKSSAEDLESSADQALEKVKASSAKFREVSKVEGFLLIHNTWISWCWTSLEKVKWCEMWRLDETNDTAQYSVQVFCFYLLHVASPKKSIGEALTQEHANEMADGIASILGEEMQGLEKRQHSGLVWFSLMRW